MIWVIIFWLAILIVSLFFLVKCSDWFIESAKEVGLYLGIPAFIVGLIIVAFGTSFPELVSSIFSVVKGSSEIVFGNVVGSNIANILLVFGIIAIQTKSFVIKHENFRLEMLTLLGITGVSIFFLYQGVTIMEAILFLFVLVMYVVASVRKHTEDNPEKVKLKKLTFPLLLLGLFGTLISANYVIESVLKLSELFSIESGVLAATVVALGTSLPEVMVSITAVTKNEADIAVGNVIGSNIFNFLAVVGISRFFGPIGSVAFWTLIPILIMVTILFFLMTLNRTVKRWYGVTLIALYGMYFLAAFL
jgi:cation:H+ antiporter